MSKNYPANVSVLSIKPAVDKPYRFSLELQNNLQSNNECTVVIMMNPSVANVHCSDVTVNKVIRALSTVSQKIIILNLFPFYESRSEGLGKLVIRNHNAWLNGEIDAISLAIENSNKVIFAWGDVPKGLPARLHNERVKAVIEIIESKCRENSLYVFNYTQGNDLKFISKKNRPLHPSRKRIHSLKKVKTYIFRRDLVHLEFV